MIQKMYKVFNVKTGEVFTCNHHRLQIAKKHGLDKNWDVIPLSDPPNPMTLGQIAPLHQEQTLDTDLPKTRKTRKKNNDEQN